MSTDKPARQYTKLINDLKVIQQRNRELEAALQQRVLESEAEALRTAGRIQDAVDAALSVAHADHAETRRQLSALRGELDLTMRALSATSAERDEAQRALLAATVRADGLAAQVADIQPQLALIDQQRDDLTHILDSVRERMRRRELQDEQAILNRRALAGATPGKNWG